jgi:hypothetical protein
MLTSASVVVGQLAPRGGEFVINSVTAGNQRQPGIVALPDGGFVVVWRQPAGTVVDDQIGARRRPPICRPRPKHDLFWAVSVLTESRTPYYAYCVRGSHRKRVAKAASGPAGAISRRCPPMFDARGSRQILR